MHLQKFPSKISLTSFSVDNFGIVTKDSEIVKSEELAVPASENSTLTSASPASFS